MAKFSVSRTEYEGEPVIVEGDRLGMREGSLAVVKGAEPVAIFAKGSWMSVMPVNDDGDSALSGLGMLTASMRESEDFAWSWQCNIASSVMEEGVTDEVANRAAARFMLLAFGINVTKFDHWKAFEEQWERKPKPREFWVHAKEGDPYHDAYTCPQSHIGTGYKEIKVREVLP